MEVFDKTGLNCFGVLFIVFIDIGKSLSGCWIDISFDAFVKYRNEFVFGQAFFRQFVIGESDFFLLEGLLSNFSGLCLQILNFFVPDEREFVANSECQFSDIAQQTQLSSRLDREGFGEQFDNNDEHDNMFGHSKPSFRDNPIRELLVAGLKMSGCNIHNISIFCKQQQKICSYKPVFNQIKAKM